LKEILVAHPGRCIVYFHLRNGITIKAKEVRIYPAENLLKKLRQLLGENNLELKGKWEGVVNLSPKSRPIKVRRRAENV